MTTPAEHANRSGDGQLRLLVTRQMKEKTETGGSGCGTVPWRRNSNRQETNDNNTVMLVEFERIAATDGV
jgi:hypothetical protein